MVKTVLEAVANIAQLIVTFGGSAAVSTAKGATIAALRTAKNFASKGLSKAAFKKMMKSQAKKIGTSIKDVTLDHIWDDSFKPEEIAFDLAASLDPTGLVAVAQSFVYELC